MLKKGTTSLSHHRLLGCVLGILLGDVDLNFTVPAKHLASLASSFMGSVGIFRMSVAVTWSLSWTVLGVKSWISTDRVKAVMRPRPWCKPWSHVWWRC